MQRNGSLRSTTIAAIAGCTFVTFGDAASAQERVRWDLASSYGSQIDVLGKNILRVIDNIETMSDGHFEIPRGTRDVEGSQCARRAGVGDLP